MRTLLLPLLMCLAAGAAEVQHYDTRLDLVPGRAASATATVVLTGAASEIVDLPVGFKVSAFQPGQLPPGLRLEPCPGGIRAFLPPARGEWRFTFTFEAEGVMAAEVPALGEKATMPASSWLVRHAFVNTKDSVIRDYSVEAYLPSGYRFQSIKEQLPRLRKTEVEPRVLLGRKEGRQTAVLHNTGLKQGDGASMLLEGVPTRRSPLWMLAGLAIAFLYLFLFRDMVRPEA